MVHAVESQEAFAKTRAVERIAQSKKSNPENEQRKAITAEEKKAQGIQRRDTETAHPDEVILHRDRQQEKKKQNKKAGKDAEPIDETNDGTIDGQNDGNNDETKPASDDPDTSHGNNTPPPVLDIQV